MNMLVPKKLLMTPWFPSSLDSLWNDDLIASNNDNGLSISEDDKNVYVKAAVPGIDPKDIDLTYNKGILTVKGETSEKEEKKKIIRQSRQSFYYQLTVPGDVDDKGVKALPVALSGRVLVKVTTEGGEIKAGDPLTTSSTPGVAMKAIKTGAIIGTAMSDFNGDGVGKILVFIKNGFGNGDKIADLLPGVDENATDFAKQILDELVWQKNNLVLTDLSEIITDRLVAGVEIITPKIVTDKTQTRNLCVGEEGNETCITKSQLDQLLSRFDIGNTETLVPTLTPTPTGVGVTLDTTLLTE